MNKTFIIAEAGVNHNGCLDNAKKLIDMAFDCGADAIKFQTFKAYESTGIYADKAQYQKNNMPNDMDSQYEMIKKLELAFDDFNVLKNYCDKKGIMFISTPDGQESLCCLLDLSVSIIKISSTEVTNYGFLESIARTNKKVILSTGMSTLGEVERAIDAIKTVGNENIWLMHCTTSYPTELNEVNLLAMETMRNAFKLPVGLSDHTLGFESAIAAVSLGAICIEKHITLDKNMEGPDHKASMDMNQFSSYVKHIRNTEKLLGDGIKKPTVSEKAVMKEVRRSLVAKCDLEVGHIIEKKDLEFKRPGTGLSYDMTDFLIGRKLKRVIRKDEVIDLKDI